MVPWTKLPSRMQLTTLLIVLLWVGIHKSKLWFFLVGSATCCWISYVAESSPMSLVGILHFFHLLATYIINEFEIKSTHITTFFVLYRCPRLSCPFDRSVDDFGLFQMAPNKIPWISILSTRHAIWNRAVNWQPRLEHHNYNAYHTNYFFRIYYTTPSAFTFSFYTKHLVFRHFYFWTGHVTVQPIFCSQQ